MFYGLAAVGNTVETQVDNIFSAYHGDGIPGAAIMVIQDGEPVMIRTFGTADIEREIAVSPETNFRLASITKQFTATCIMILVERGELQLDATLPELFSGFPAYGEKNHTSPLTAAFFRVDRLRIDDSG